MTIHHLKTWPKQFEAVITGGKPFEVRRNDRPFTVGDILVLHEFDPGYGLYSTRECRRLVTYILPGGQFGIEPDFIVMGIRPVFIGDNA